MTDRAVSVAVNYTITLIIATLLIGGLLMAAGGLIESQSRTAIHDELDVLGQNVGANLMSADRMVSVVKDDEATSPEVYLRVDLPPRVGGSAYLIDIEEEAIILRSVDPEVNVSVSYTIETGISETTVSGGSLIIEYDEGENELEVRNA